MSLSIFPQNPKVLLGSSTRLRPEWSGEINPPTVSRLTAACSTSDVHAMDLHLHQHIIMGNRQEELEAILWQANYDLVAITETG